MAGKRVQEPAAVAGGCCETWKGRLRSHHATPRRSPPPSPLPSRVKNLEEAARMFKKQGAPKNPRRGGQCSPEARRRSPRLSARELDYSLVLLELSKVSKIEGDQWGITPVRRSPRFHPEMNTGDSIFSKATSDQCSGKPFCKEERNCKKKQEQKLGVCVETRRNRNRKTDVKPLPENKNHKVALLLTPNPQEIAPRRRIQNVSSETSEKKRELKPKIVEDETRKRKRGSDGKPSRASRKKKRHQNAQLPPPNAPKIAPNNEAMTAIRNNCERKPCMTQPKTGGERSANNGRRSTEELDGIQRGKMEQLCGLDDWTEEQDMALHQAYFTARPSPHFWKKVSKMVPGKSAEECFNRVHADLATPTPNAPRSRLSKMKLSPLGHLTLSDPKLPGLLESKVGRQRTTKQKNLAAQKTVRHLLKKHCLIDQAQEADHFSIFETSPNALQLDISFESSPGTPSSCLNSGLPKCNSSLSAQKRPLLRFKAKQDEPSPAVLKPVKNVVLHEKYIDQLSRREATKKRPHKKASAAKAADPVKIASEQQTKGLKAARNALISEATDFISHFKKLQANSHAHFVDNGDNDEDDSIECDTSDLP